MFDSVSYKEARPIALLKKAALVGVSVFIVLGIISSHRAYYQVRSLEIDVSEQVLRAGSDIRAQVVTSGRTVARVQFELVQGNHSETLAWHQVAGNEFGFFDPRKQRAEFTVALTPDMLSRFQSGTAQLRVTAHGTSQWTRVPPPVVREMSVELRRD